MKMMTTHIIVTSWMLLLATTSWSQSFPAGTPVVSGANVNSNVTLDLNTGILTYSYIVTNSSSSAGSLDSFLVDITTTPGGVPLDFTGLTSDAIGFEKIITASNVGNLGPSVIPIGFESQPVGWKGAVDSNGNASWFSGLPPAIKIAPSTSLSGFVVTSRGVPGIRKFTVGSYIDPAALFPTTGDESEEELTKITALANAAAQATNFNGMTVGPVSPPSLTNTVQLLDFLISLKHQAASLGWLRGDEFIKDLDEKLDQAKEALAKGHGFQAGKKLEQFIGSLDDQRHKQEERRRHDHREPETFLSGNAYNLLKPNAEFILSKLPKPTDKDDRERHSEDGGK